jgi:hypothetical protein
MEAVIRYGECMGVDGCGRGSEWDHYMVRWLEPRLVIDLVTG